VNLSWSNGSSSTHGKVQTNNNSLNNEMMVGNVCSLLLLFFVLDLFAMGFFPFVLPPPPQTKGNVLPKFQNNELIVHTR
jgi:hypothetical protein